MKRILYAQAVFGQEEKDAVAASLNNPWLAAGEKVSEFESQVAKQFGKRHGIAVNSGSSANLLALAAINLGKGAEVITPACTFATTIAPIVQNGYVPVLVDSVIGRYTIDEKLVEAAITKKTGAIMVPQLVGGVCDMDYLKRLANIYGLFLIDDSCDTFAPQLGMQPLSRFADITTTSFYGSHIITSMGSGGMIMTDNYELYEKLKSLANWGRVGSDNEDFSQRFDYELDNIPYDAKFIYSNLGFNVKMTEAQAAFGLEQLKKLQGFINVRQRHHAKLIQYFRKYQEWFHLPYTIPQAKTTWLAFALTVADDAPFTRYAFAKHLDQNNVQIRVLFSGNIAHHPAYNNVKYRVASDLSNADKIMESGLLIGCHHGLDDNDIDNLIDICEDFLKKYEKN